MRHPRYLILTKELSIREQEMILIYLHEVRRINKKLLIREMQKLFSEAMKTNMEIC